MRAIILAALIPAQNVLTRYPPAVALHLGENTVRTIAMDGEWEHDFIIKGRTELMLILLQVPRVSFEVPRSSTPALLVRSEIPQNYP